MSDFKGWFLPAEGLKIHYTTNGDSSVCGNVWYIDAILNHDAPPPEQMCRRCAALLAVRE